MTDLVGVVPKTSELAPEVAPSCYDLLSNWDIELGQMTGFDNGHGMLLLTEGSTCWNDLREAFQSLVDFMEEQLELAAVSEVGENAEEDVKEVAAAVGEEVAEEAEEATGI